MKLKIDSFYLDAVYSVVKYKGIKDGNLIFDRYVKSYDGWEEMGQRVNLDHGFQTKRDTAGRTKPILPPQ